MKNIYWTWLVGGLIFWGCASKTVTQKKASQETQSQIETGSRPTEEQDQEVSSEALVLKTPVYGVWIDAVGFDGLMALGVLQEMEKLKLKPAKIVGTGFGCWIATAWAISNSGNQAEWQSFKWKDWDLAKKEGLLQRIRGKSTEDKLRPEVQKHFTKTKFQELTLPSDCPFIPKSSPFHFQTGRFVEIDRAISIQLLVPLADVSVGVPEDASWYSGAIAGIPNNEELKNFAADILENLKDNEFWAGWIVLKTRNFSDLTVDFKVMQAAQMFRNDERSLNLESFDGQLFDLRKSSSAFLQTRSLNVYSSDSRRLWLVEGRRQAPEIIQKLNQVNFFKPTP